MRFSERVTLVEVGPRDGLQSLPRSYPTEVKVELVELLADAGLEKIEVTGFVHPEVIPQLADAEAVLAAIDPPPEVALSVLVPNRRGLDRALAVGGFHEIGVFLSATETHNRRNVNRSVVFRISAAPVATSSSMVKGFPSEMGMMLVG